MTNKLIHAENSSKATAQYQKGSWTIKRYFLFLCYFKKSALWQTLKKRLSTVTFSHDDIGKMIQNLNPDKTHFLDNISFCILKIRGSSVYGPLELIFKETISAGFFPSDWKKGIIVPVHKRGDKQILKIYRPVLLFPIYGEFFERTIFNEVLNFLLENNLISPNQSGFKPRDSCINQLSSTTRNLQFIWWGIGSRVLLDISKAFDKMW